MNSLRYSEDLAYFISLQESRKMDTPESSAKKWNQRAENWKKEREHNRKDNERVERTIEYLEQNRLLQSHYDIADIGCGPGRFAAAFAKRVHNVVGLDISEKMVAHGMEHIQSEGIANVQLYTCDFQSLDIEKAGYKRAFDLVFCSMTPAIHDMDTLMKSMEMSRGWCCHITHLNSRNFLKEQIMQEVFGKKAAYQWTGKWFYSLFNILFLLGYHPETSYDTRHRESWIDPDEEFIEYMLEYSLPASEMTKENMKKVQNWFQTHQNEEGKVLEITDSSYGRILWDVRNKVERHEY